MTNDWINTLFDCWRHGARISLVEYLGYHLVNIYYALGEVEEIKFLHSEFCEAFWFYIKLADVMEDINGERYSIISTDEDDSDEEFIEWLHSALGYS
jgi:hypothetical protein